MFPSYCVAGGQAYKLIMEYVPMGSLKEYLPRHKKGTSLNTLLNYSMQICKVRGQSCRLDVFVSFVSDPLNATLMCGAFNPSVYSGDGISGI